jgi:hypothetical protein
MAKVQNQIVSVISKDQVIMMIHIDNLQIDRSYQRNETSVAKRIEKDFNESALGILQVCQRKTDKKLYVVDGQNRLIGLRGYIQNGGKANPFVLCMVHLNTNKEQEIKLFLQLNSGKAVDGANKFKANLELGNEPEVTINSWVESCGLRFLFTYFGCGTPRKEERLSDIVTGPSTMRDAYDKGINNFEDALKFLMEICTDKITKQIPYKLRSGGFIVGVAIFLKKFNTKKVLHSFKEKPPVDFLLLWATANKIGSGYARYQALAMLLENEYLKRI